MYILETYGAPAQMIKLAEECSELAAFLAKYTCEKLIDPAAECSEIEESIRGEIADVENLIYQVRLIIGSRRIDEIKAEKIERTIKRIKMERGKKKC